jgi:acyl transferase domain-containing protein
MIFVFCGVGTAWNGMCRELLKVRHFRKIFNEIDVHLRPLAGWSVTAKLQEDSEFVADKMIAHIAIFACQVGLASLWDHFGVKADAVIGQSVGEVAAAHAAGYIDMKTAVYIIFHRSQVLANITEGTMAVVQNVETTIVESYCKQNGTVNIAVYNSPSSCTVSGKAEDIEKLKSELQQRENNVPEFISLDVNCAYHSPYVADAAKNVAKKLKNLAGKTGNIPMFSTVTGHEERNGIFGTPSYWENNVAMPVKFFSAINLSFVEKKHNIFIEIGPNPV